MARADPIADLKKRFSNVVSKRSSVLVGLRGEAGVGKSWLAEQLLREIPCRSVSVQATAREAELTRTLPRSERLPLWVERRLESSPDPTATPLSDALAAQLVALAPFVLHVEDFQNASLEQRERWLALADAVKRSRGVGLLVASRTEVPEVFETVRLEPLSAEEAVTLLEAEVQVALPAQAHAWIAERACGNPLFTLEYFRHLTRQGLLWSDGKRWRWRVPERDAVPISIEALVAQRLREAAPTPEARLILGVKALVPEVADDLCAEIADVELGAFQEASSHLEKQGVFQAGGFAHRLTREVALGELSKVLRRDLAQRAIHVLELEHPEAAADLVAEAELSPAEAERLLRRAADSTSGTRAARFLARAAPYATGLERSKLALQAARQLRHTDLPEAARLSELALQADPNNEEITFLRAQLLSALGEGQEAEIVLRTLPPERQELTWLEALIEVRVNRYDYAGVWELWEGHPELKGATGVPSYVHVGRALTQLGRFDEARALLDSAMKPELPPFERAWLESSYGLVLLLEGDFAAAVSHYDTALSLFTTLENSVENNAEVTKRRGDAFSLRSLALYRWGRYREAIADLKTYLRLVSEQGRGRAYAEGQVNLGTYLIEVGEFERAEEVLLESRGVLERADNVRWLAGVERALVQLYLDWAPPYGSALALKHAQAAEGYARRAESPTILAQILYFMSRAEATCGRPQRALELVEELQTLANHSGETHLEVVGTWVRGLALEKLGQREAALQNLDEAAKWMKHLGHEPFANRLALEGDRVRNDAAAAATRVEHFERIGNRNWLTTAHRYFPQLTESPAPPPSFLLHLKVLGSVSMERNGVPLTYRARQGKLLLAHLLEARIAGRSEVTQLDLLDALYTETDEEKAAAALKQLVYRLRSALGSEAVTRTNSGYALGEVSSDAEAFLRSGDTSLWRGPYLEDLGGGDSSAQDALYHALRLQAVERLRTEPQETVRLTQLLLKADPFDLEALALYVRARHLAGNTTGLERSYQQYGEQFAEVGEALPESWHTFLQDYAA